MSDSFPSNDEYFKNKKDVFCQICRKKIEDNEIKVPRVEEIDDQMIHGFAHRWCENETNDYMKWSEDGLSANLTLKGQFMQWIKMWVILGAMINEKLHGRSIFDDEPKTESKR